MTHAPILRRVVCSTVKHSEEFRLGPMPTDPPIQPPEAGAADMCKTIGSAIERAMVEGRHDQGSLAKRMGVSRGYLNLIISGKRKASVYHVLRAVKATGSLVPIQWVCKQVGGELDWDELSAEEQAARATLARIESIKQREQSRKTRAA